VDHADCVLDPAASEHGGDGDRLRHVDFSAWLAGQFLATCRQRSESRRQIAECSAPGEGCTIV
jgi:hypothetical protein